MPRLSGKDNLLNYSFSIIGIFFQVVLQHLRNRLGNSGTHLSIPQLGFGLPLKLWFGHLYRNYGGQSLSKIISSNLKLEFIEEPGGVGVFF